MMLILGSKSVFRRQLMWEAGYNFEAIAADIDEKVIRSDQPEALVCLLAQAKANAIIAEQDLFHEHVVLTSDQVIVCGGKILEKPLDRWGNPEENLAKAYLVGYSVNPAIAYTSVYAVVNNSGVAYCGYDVTKIWFEKFTQDQIETIVADEHTYQAAGALPTGVLGSEASAILQSKILKVEGDMSGFIGLPMPLVAKALKHVGYYHDFH